MSNKKQNPDDVSILPRETKSSDEGRGITRRQLIKRTGKATYIAPTLTVLALAPVNVAAFSTPPPPPTSGANSEPRNSEEERRRR